MSTAAYEFEAMHEMGPAHEWEYEAEGEYEFGSLLNLAQGAAQAVLGALGESEWESEYEAEAELNPVRKIYSDAALEHMAHEALHAQSEGEAGEAFLPLIPMVAAKLIPLAAKALPMVAKALPKVVSAVSRLTPHLTRGVSKIAGTLFRNPQTRGLLRALPSIARRTVGAVARRAAQGMPITPQMATRTLARQAAGVLARRHHLRGALRRSRLLDRVYHRRVAPALRVLPAVRGAMRTGGGWYGGGVPGGGVAGGGVAGGSLVTGGGVYGGPVYGGGYAASVTPIGVPAVGPGYAPAPVRGGGCGCCCCCGR